jgi:RNA 3'-terminal phosphate cyclase
VEGGVPVGEHLADQLLIPPALAGRGGFRTLPLTPHAQTNLDVIGRFSSSAKIGRGWVCAPGKGTATEQSSLELKE